MRGALIETLCELGEADQRLALLTGDLGFSVIEPFAVRFPDRFFNVGVAEQNMIGIATGLAEAGFTPFVYSIVTFASLRGYEFVRNGPILHSLPVRLVGVGGGFEYGTAGFTHYGLEDVGIMRLHRGLTVVVPADPAQAKNAVRQTYSVPGPAYYRIGKKDAFSVPGLEGRFRLGRVEMIREGEGLLFLAMGPAGRDAAEAARRLELSGIRAAVGIVSSFNPAPIDDISDLLRRFSIVMTVEAHFIDGALGSLVCEIAGENGSSCKVIRCGVGEHAGGATGSEQYLLHRHGLSAEALTDRAVVAVAKSR
jgi:transketolase